MRRPSSPRASVLRTPCCPPCASGIWTSGRTAPAGSDSARELLSLSSRHPALVEPIRAWYKSLYDRIGRSSADTVRGYVAMMVFDGFFNSSKMGVMTLSDEEMDAMQMHVLREAYAARPDMLEVIEAVIGSGERM